MADLQLAALILAADKLEQVTRLAHQNVCRLAVAYARAETLAYSKAHPRRRIVFVSAMGSECLHVQRYGNCDDFQFSSSVLNPDDRTPQFMFEIESVVDRCDLKYIGPYKLECRGGEVISEVTDW